MDIKSYIKTCISNKDNIELKMSWWFLGGKKATNNTPMYNSGSLYVVDQPDSSFHNYFFYCDENYIGKIDWSHVSVIGDAQQTVLADGITTECFDFLDYQITVADIETLVANYSDEPFSKYSAAELMEQGSGIIIDDDTYYQIMTIMGVPFVSEGDLEYNRQAILKLAFEPAMKAYFASWPIVEPEVIYLQGGDFDIKFPEMAMQAVAWTTVGGAGATTMSINPLAAIRTPALMTSGMFNSGYRSQINYRKPYPGWTGTDGENQNTKTFCDTFVLSNTLRNASKREHWTRVHRPDGLHLVGYTTSSKTLNVKWLKWSRDFADVVPDDWEEMYRLCQASVKRVFGPLRSLLRQDQNIPFDSKEMMKEGQQEWLEIVKAWKDSPYGLIYTPQHGGIYG